ncbi:MAG: DUF2784 domain-containing protein [Vicinamibacterales bacterium]
MTAALADAIVLVHFAFVLFVLLGGLLVLSRPWTAWLHLPAALWGAWIEFAGWICPLTPIENWLRSVGGGQTYDASFVDRYVVSILYPPALTRDVQWTLGAVVLAINAAVYFLVWRRYRGR